MWSIRHPWILWFKFFILIHFIFFLFFVWGIFIHILFEWQSFIFSRHWTMSLKGKIERDHHPYDSKKKQRIKLTSIGIHSRFSSFFLTLLLSRIQIQVTLTFVSFLLFAWSQRDRYVTVARVWDTKRCKLASEGAKRCPEHKIML